MELVQSFIFSLARVKLSLYEQRIMLKVVENAQLAIKGVWLKDNLTRLRHDDVNIKISMLARDVMSEGSKHYEDVKAAIRSLEGRRFEFYDSVKKVWFSSPVIYNARIATGTGVVTFFVADVVYDVILDFTKGWSKYNLEAALALPSPYAVRMYALMNSQTHPVDFPVERLKEMFAVQDKYSQTADFIKKVIDPSMKALEDAGLNGFDYERLKIGTKVTALRLIPKKRQEKKVVDLLAQLPVSAIISKELKIVLMSHMGFTSKELSANKAVLDAFCRIPDNLERLMAIEHRWRKGQKKKGYVISAMKGECKDFGLLKS